MNPDPDAWLDAFDPAELDDPVLATLDAAVDRVVRSSPAPAAGPRRRVGPWIAVGAAMVTLAAAALLVLGSPGPAPLPTYPIESASIAELATGPDLHPRIRLVVAPEDAPALQEPAPAVVAVRPLPPVVSEAPEAPEVQTPAAPPVLAVQKRPGLSIQPGSQASLDGRQVRLTRGVLVYQHDAEHEPGVRSLRFTDPALIVRPVGTAFAAAAQHGLAAVRVTEGEVWLQHTDGRPITTLRPGDEVLLGTENDRLTWVSTTGIGLGELPEALRLGNGAAQREVISLLASVRLAAREGLTEATLPFALPTEPSDR